MAAPVPPKPIRAESVPIRSGTTVDWAATALVLGDAELGVDVTSGAIKVGNGTDLFGDLRTINPRIWQTTATLDDGEAVVSHEAGIFEVPAEGAIVFLTVQSLGTVTEAQAVAVTELTPSNGLTITSADPTDTSVVGVLIIEP